MERIISERVISEKVVGGGIPIIGGFLKKFGNLGSAISGLCIAPVVFVLAFGAAYMSENIDKKSQKVELLDMVTAAEASTKDGMVKFSGTATIAEPASAPEVGSVLYFDYTKEEYREVEEKETVKQTVVENGQEVEKTIEKTKLVEKWVQTESREEWADFSVGEIKIKSEKAKKEFDLTKKQFSQKGSGAFVVYKESVSPKLGDVKVTVNSVATGDKLIIVGEVSDKIISVGDPFIISNLDEAELIQSLTDEENTKSLGFKVFAGILFFIAFSMILAPIVALADFIPLVGKAAGTLAGVISLILAIIMTILSIVLIKFWFLFILIGVGIIGVLFAILVFVVVTKVKK